MLKFEGVAKVGEYIKAMDFRPYEGQDDMFVIGKVIEKGQLYVDCAFTDRKIPLYEGYTIECVYDTEGDRVTREINVPFEVGMVDWDDRVQYLSEGAMRMYKLVDMIVAGR